MYVEEEGRGRMLPRRWRASNRRNNKVLGCFSRKKK
jgi:hypothetical protein